MKFLDFFAGIGGFRRGMELVGHECIGFCEYDKFATASYISMHCITDEQREYLATLDLKQRQKEILKDEYRNGEWYANDIRRVDARTIPRADCWCFGFPCQDISIAGKCLGFAGDRSSLFFATTKLIRDLGDEDRPKWLFIENVKNLLSVNGGLDFARLLVELDDIGYDAEWQVLNSKDFGVPQNRERIFIIGHLRGGGYNRSISSRRKRRKKLCSSNRATGKPPRQSKPISSIWRRRNIADTEQDGRRRSRAERCRVLRRDDRGGIQTTKTARAIPARYTKGMTHHAAELSLVACPITQKENPGFED